MRHTKIIATLGPASTDTATLDALIAGGVDIVRLNFSHGTHADHAARFHAVREAARLAGRHVAVLQDLSGPKIRTGRLIDGQAIPLVVNDQLIIEIGDGIGHVGRVFTSYAPLATAVKSGDRLLMDDGHLELAVESATPEAIVTRVVEGGRLGEHKGINAPHVPLPAVGVTEKDARDLVFGLALGVDLVALSFVQSRADIDAARLILAREGRPDVPIIAKLERPEAVARLEEILDATDAVMVARGDLGLEIPLEQVPRVQKEILVQARRRGIPVIIATQVLESMRVESRPTRAEVSDAAGAVDGGADAIMLSGETATGAHPVKAVAVLDTIIRGAEVPSATEMPMRALLRTDWFKGDHVGALCDAAVRLATASFAEAIVAVTREGRTARRLSALRPQAPIYAVTDRHEVARRLALWWGVATVVMPVDGDVEPVAAAVVDGLQHSGALKPGQTAVIVNTTPSLDRGAANFIKLRRV